MSGWRFWPRRPGLPQAGGHGADMKGDMQRADLPRANLHRGDQPPRAGHPPAQPRQARGPAGADLRLAENPHAGEVVVVLNGQAYPCKLTLGALAALEAALPDRSLPALVARLESGGFSASDILAVITAGLRGGGAWPDPLGTGNEADLARADFQGGPMAAAEAAGLLLARAFAPPP